ncbi:MAG: hypothetical protein UT05_C0009G0020 [Parcubacteria group bacterium GW2011_GWF2_38_76]|nr:MAG: hypothetical protein UT05_C0009G0020 [Parcubacteria group bacterium GW2011_GWF2_38_76]HBM45463.1 hypothetical protein [Patescibacteria group bacterium]
MKEIPICSKAMGGCGYVGIGQELKDWKKGDNYYVCPVCGNIAIIQLNKNNVRLHVQDKKELKKALAGLGIKTSEIKD